MPINSTLCSIRIFLISNRSLQLLEHRQATPICQVTQSFVVVVLHHSFEEMFHVLVFKALSLAGVLDKASPGACYHVRPMLGRTLRQIKVSFCICTMDRSRSYKDGCVLLHINPCFIFVPWEMTLSRCHISRSVAIRLHPLMRWTPMPFVFIF